MVCCREEHTAAPPVRMIGGARFRTVYVAGGVSPRARVSAYAAARTLAREGVRRAVFPPDYAYRETFARRGIAAPPLAELHCATAAAIVLRRMAERGIDPRGASVAFTADAVTPELRRAVRTLAVSVRYIALAVPFGGEELARSLKRELGVAARLLTPDEAERADLTVAFSPAAADGDVLALRDPALAVVYAGELPSPLLAALWAMGAVDADALEVCAVRTGGPSVTS